MRTRLMSFWHGLREGFWFLPAVLTLAAFFLSMGTLSLDEGLKQEGLSVWGIYKGGPEGARAVLSAVASSMISVTGITFSITIVTLTLASSQFGPRLLRNFMRDTGTQVVLGIFLATFVYCLMVLRRVNGQEQHIFVPHVSVSVGVGLALGSLGLLIYFIHHVARSIQAETVIAAVGRDLDEAIEKLYPQMLGEGAREACAAHQQELPPNFERDAMTLKAQTEGYIHAIDGEALLSLAVEHDLVVRVNYKPGDYVLKGATLAHAWPAKAAQRVGDKMNAVFLTGNHRTGEQDPEFAAHQLVEVALRALSRGTNDPFTAINCIDRLGAALAKLAGRVIPSGFRFDEKQRLRVLTEVNTFQDVVEAAFEQIRQSGRANAAVSIRLLEIIREISEHARLPEHRAALLRQAEMIERGSRAALPEEEDRRDVRTRYEEVIDALGGRQIP